MDDVGSDFDKMIVTLESLTEFAEALNDLLSEETNIPNDIVRHIIYTKYEYLYGEHNNDLNSDYDNESTDMNESTEVWDMLASQTDYNVWKNKVYADFKINVDFFDIEKYANFGDVLYNNILINLKKQELHQVFRDCYIRCIQSTKDGTILRRLLPKTHSEDVYDQHEEIKLSGLKLTKIPHYFKKYAALTKVDLSNNDFTELNATDFPEQVEHLVLSNCRNLINIKPKSLPFTKTLVLSKCPNLNTLHYPIKTKSDNSSCNLMLFDTAITSMDKITFELNDILASPLIISLPKNFTSFESIDNNMAGINNVTYRFGDVQDKLTSFIGARIPRDRDKGIVMYKKFENPSNNTISRVEELNTPETFQKYFPNIKNAYKKYKTYLEIKEVYTNLIYTPKLTQLYKLTDPESLMEFKYIMNNNYDVSPNILAKLIKYITA